MEMSWIYKGLHMKEYHDELKNYNGMGIVKIKSKHFIG